MPRVAGIDDWTWQRGQRYGTLICDLQRRKVIGLPPDQQPSTVEAWLRHYPQIKVFARDRNGGYCKAVSRALPESVQVADRGHLLENSGASFLGAITRSFPEIRKAVHANIVDPTLLTRAEHFNTTASCAVEKLTGSSD